VWSVVVCSPVQSGAVELYEQDMIEGVLDLQRTQVQQIMTPRVEIEAVETSAPLSELLDVALRTK
jgi:CBS domain containing-hemolysin-like protein